MIHDEWTRNLLQDRPELGKEALDKTVELMNAAVDDCLVENFDYLIDSLNLPDKNDRHVLAAAIVGHADAIVSFNLKDFPEESLKMHGVEILHPDDFLVAQYGLNSVGFLTIVKQLRQRLKNPPKSAEELIATCRAQSLPQLASLLEVAVDLI